MGAGRPRVQPVPGAVLADEPAAPLPVGLWVFALVVCVCVCVCMFLSPLSFIFHTDDCRPVPNPRTHPQHYPPTHTYLQKHSFCGSLCCADCTRFRLGPNQKRACMLCHLAVQRARRDFEENGDDDAASSQQTSPRFHGADGLGADYGVDMTERMLTLESRLGHLERQRRVGKARLLLRCADWAMATQTASLLLAGLLVGHYAALLAGERGWDATGVAWVQGLMVIPSPSSFYLPPWLLDALQPGGGVDTSSYGYWAVLLGGVGLAGLVAASTLYRRSVTAFSVVRDLWVGWAGGVNE